MHILVSFCNIKTPGLPLLGLLDANSLAFEVLDLPEELGPCSGITGLALSEKYIYTVVQGHDVQQAARAAGSSTLHIFDRANLNHRSRYVFCAGADVHSLCAQADRLHVVSTGTDEVLELKLRKGEVVSETVCWRPDPAGPRQDIHHLNAICDRQGDLILSSFGKKTDQLWKSASDGLIINISRQEIWAQGIDHPHSLVILGDTVAYCESRSSRVTVADGSRSQHLPGYTRGLCVIGSKLFVATSIGRQQSRSTGVNNPAAGGLLAGQCTICRLDAHSFEIERIVELGGHAQEIYDLLPVDGASCWPTIAEMTWRDTAIRSLTSSLDQRIKHTRRLMEEIDQRDTSLAQASQKQQLHETILSEVVQLRSTIQRQADQLQAQQASLEFMRETALKLLNRWAPGVAKQFAYLQVVEQIRAAALEVIPPGSKVIVVSKGDDALMQLDGLRAGHFPQTRDGAYAGYYPANSTAAIAQLEALRAKGADYFILPQPALWWLDHYREFKRHLDQRYRPLFSRAGVGIIFALRQPAPLGRVAWSTEFQQALGRCQRLLRCEPSVLDWDTGLGLHEGFPSHIVFSPPGLDAHLPYLDHSVDLVAIRSEGGDRLAEARRVARLAVATFARPDHDSQVGLVGRASSPSTLDGLEARPTSGRSGALEVEWQTDVPTDEDTTVSIIIPCHNGASYTDACLTALQETLPADFRGEVIVVDDASTDDTPSLLEQWAATDGRVVAQRNEENTGFVGSCNRAAAGASGEILIFLNNDAIPLPGWLPPILETFRLNADAGAVGGKLIYPDGTLQEAGAVIFSDGSGANLGRGDLDVDAPLYSYVREVDYCSGALLATKRQLFQDLGGFDIRYQPAYYEDADYCFKVREAGLRTYYQPDARIVHFEGVTAGTDIGKGIKRYQQINRSKFTERWSEALTRQPLPVSRFDAQVWRGLAERNGFKGRDSQ